MKKLLFTLALSSMLVTACSKDDKPKPKTDMGEHKTEAGTFNMQAAQLITVTDLNGQAVAGAQVLIGEALNSPFSGNFLTANNAGQVALPKEWTSPQTITVGAPGYMRVTYVNQQPSALTFKLCTLATPKKYQVSGVTANQPITDFDGIVDFGLVMPAFSKADLLVFDLNSIISPEHDVISAIGQRIQVPANLSVEKQKESYSIFNVTLDKPGYRVFFDRPQQAARLFAARGRFPFKPVVDALRSGKNFTGILNLISIEGGGIRDTEVREKLTDLNIPVNEMNFPDKRHITAPVLAPDEAFLGVGLAENSGYSVPTDLKRLSSGQSIDLSSWSDGKTQFLGVLKRAADLEAENTSDQVSTALMDYGATNTLPTMLPLIASPVLNGRNLSFPRVNSVGGITPLATYSVLSEVQQTAQGTKKIQVLRPLWEIYAPNWVEGVKIPEWPQDNLIPAGLKRWGVSFVGSQNATSQPSVGPDIIKDATHVTHSSIDF